jgi:preprotein translocase subunit SecD
VKSTQGGQQIVGLPHIHIKEFDMKITKRFCTMVSFSFLLFVTACAPVMPTSKFDSIIDFVPKGSPAISNTSINEAAQVLQKRFDEVLPGIAAVSISNKALQTSISDVNVRNIAIRLATDADVIIFWGSSSQLQTGQSIPSDADVVFTNSDISSAEAKFDNGVWLVSVQLTGDGGQRFFDYSSSHIGEFLNIGYGGKVISSPQLQTPIKNGALFIVGSFSEMDAKILAAQLNSGPLPYGLEVADT